MRFIEGRHEFSRYLVSLLKNVPFEVKCSYRLKNEYSSGDLYEVCYVLGDGTRFISEEIIRDSLEHYLKDQINFLIPGKTLKGVNSFSIECVSSSKFKKEGEFIFKLNLEKMQKELF